MSKRRYGYQCLGSLTCAQMLMHAIAHEGCTETVRESALKVDSERKSSGRTRESNLYQSDALPTELHPRPVRCVHFFFSFFRDSLRHSGRTARVKQNGPLARRARAEIIIMIDPSNAGSAYCSQNARSDHRIRQTLRWCIQHYL